MILPMCEFNEQKKGISTKNLCFVERNEWFLMIEKRKNRKHLPSSCLPLPAHRHTSDLYTIIHTFKQCTLNITTYLLCYLIVIVSYSQQVLFRRRARGTKRCLLLCYYLFDKKESDVHECMCAHCVLIQSNSLNHFRIKGILQR